MARTINSRLVKEPDPQKKGYKLKKQDRERWGENASNDNVTINFALLLESFSSRMIIFCSEITFIFIFSIDGAVYSIIVNYEGYIIAVYIFL